MKNNTLPTFLCTLLFATVLSVAGTTNVSKTTMGAVNPNPERNSVTDPPNHCWWSGEGDDLANQLISPELDLTGVGTAHLSFWHRYDIETGDHGSFFVSTDGGNSWHNLGYYTVSSPWTEATFDLFDYTGETILLMFEYVTDASAYGGGWHVDDISIPEIAFFEDVESGPGSWAPDGWTIVEKPKRVRNVDTGLDYWMIQPAIDAPETLGGHRIVVEPGTYEENLEVYKSVLLLGAKADSWSDWPMFHHDAQRTGRTDFKGPYPLEPLGGQWPVDIGYEILSSPAVAGDGTIYIGIMRRGSARKLYAINPNGTIKWRFDITENYGGISASPAIGPDGTIYVGTEDGNFFAVNPNGTEKWSLHIPFGISKFSSPVVVIDPNLNKPAIYVGNNCGDLCKIVDDDPSPGYIEWHVPVSDVFPIGFPSSPAIGPISGTIFVGNKHGFLTDIEGEIVALNPDGSQRWRIYVTEGGENTVFSPAVQVVNGDEIVWAGTSDGYMRAVKEVSPTAAEIVMDFEAGGFGWIMSCPAICDLNDDGKVEVIFGSGGNVHAVTYTPGQNGPTFCEEYWRFGISGNIESSPAIDKYGTVYIGSNDGCVYAISSDGTASSCYQTGGQVVSSPAISCGIFVDPSIAPWPWPMRVYVGSKDGYLYAFGTGYVLPNLYAVNPGAPVIRVTASGVIVSGLAISGAGVGTAGVHLDGVDMCEISDNVVSDNGSGIVLRGSDDCSVSGNTISNASRHIGDGVLIKDSSQGNSIVGNELRENCYGVRITNGSDGNFIYHNEFIDNAHHAYDECINTWDDGCVVGGNRWDDYTGIDADGDGMGDTPYPIPGGDNEDNCPLMMGEAVLIPTVSAWGLIVMSLLVLIVAMLILGRGGRRVSAARAGVCQS